ncbi:polysaccharide pyruvyl transferase family protein [Aeromonas caviae]|uniref:polysaccharide pyruvyl transferase family protein n=1 Tax=Aeromonas caviae TaxID=648 RepID=UPI0028DEE2CF|nr:polysaccharide pyruvyl transferase family protein [Aeromonas caviae]MDT8953423.1 polysaccharide pyruvyl transferase family protein [Aeromonas caviae]
MNILLAGKLQHDNFGDVIMAAYYMNKEHQYYLFNSTDIVLNRLMELGYNAQLVNFDNIEDVSFDACVYIGGGYFGHTYLNGSKWCSEWENKNGLYKLSRYLVEKNIKYIVQSVEVGPIYQSSLRDKIKFILENASSVTVRNKGSKQYCLNKLNLKVKEQGDIVYHESSSFFSRYIGSENNNLVVHVTDKYNGSNLLKKNFTSAILNYVKSNNQSYNEVVLITDNEVTSNLDEAVKSFCDELLKEEIEFRVVRYKNTPLPDIFKEVSNSKLMITTKLHLGVLAKSFGSNVKCFTDAPKSRRFYKDNNALHEIENFYLKLKKTTISDHAKVTSSEEPKSGVYIEEYDRFIRGLV